MGNCSGIGASDWFASLWTDTGANAVYCLYY